MLIYRNADEVHGQIKVGNLCFSRTSQKYLEMLRLLVRHKYFLQSFPDCFRW